MITFVDIMSKLRQPASPRMLDCIRVISYWIIENCLVSLYDYQVMQPVAKLWSPTTRTTLGLEKYILPTREPTNRRSRNILAMSACCIPTKDIHPPWCPGWFQENTWGRGVRTCGWCQPFSRTVSELHSAVSLHRPHWCSWSGDAPKKSKHQSPAVAQASCSCILAVFAPVSFAYGQEITRVILCRLILNDIIIHIKCVNDIIMLSKIVWHFYVTNFENYVV